MVRKRGNVDDLEYAIPKEYKQDEPSPCYQDPEPGPEACCFCGRTSDEVVLLPALYCGRDQWVCGRCLMSHDSAGVSAQPSLLDQPDAAQDSMSMFDKY